MTARTRVHAALLVGVVFLATVAAGVGPAVAAGADADEMASSQAATCTFPVTETDATGTEVTIDAEPQRVVTLGPSAAQTMWEIGAKEKVVGVSKYASYLEGADSRTNVSGASSFVVTEKVVALEPDLVLAPNIITNDTVEKLRSTGLTVYRFEGATSLGDVVRKTRLTGQLTGACDGATQRADAMNRTLATVEQAVEGTERPSVLYYMGGGYTAGEGTFIHAIIETAGGTNVAAEAGIAGWGQISEEVVVNQDPAWIVTNTDVGSIPRNAVYNGTTAVKKGQVLVVNADYVSQPAPRTVEVVQRLAKAFHPEAYAAANATTTATATTEATAATTTQTATTTAASTTTPTSTAPPTTAAGEAGTAGGTAETGATATTATSTPGLGVPVAVLAIALVGLSLRRE